MPVRRGRAGVDSQILVAVRGCQVGNWSLRQHRRRRHIFDHPPIAMANEHFARGRQLDGVTLLMHGTMMLAAKQDQILQASCASIGPMHDVMRIAES